MIREKPIKHDIMALLPEVEYYLRKRGDVLFGYLFGSFARGKTTALSDVDIAVYLSGSVFSEKRIDIIGDLMDILKTEEVDLVILNTAPVALRMRILRNKRLLADMSPFVRHSFESSTIRSYFDFSKAESKILEERYLNG